MKSITALLTPLLVLLSGVVARAAPDSKVAPAPAPRLASALIEGVPHVRQKPDFCGEACAAAWLKKLGKAWDQDAVFDVAGLDPAKGRGCYARELYTALGRIGFETGPGWKTVPPQRASLDAPFRELHADLVKGVPSIVCMRYDASPETTEHFRLVLGYDGAKDEVIYHEPAADGGAYRRMKRETFLGLWPLKYPGRGWTVIRFRLEPGKIAPPPKRGVRNAFTDADYAQVVRAVKAKVSEPPFTIVVEKPFVVVGDKTDQVLDQSRNTVRWAVDRLRKEYFPRDPPRIITVWLFRNAASYEKHATELFGSPPHTKYGYYSAVHDALVMNISTGGGTLVHEIVHPYVAANFPACPPWFNEGLGSLYEQCSERNGRIIGLTNWRLKGLKTTIRRKALMSFEDLTAMNSGQFYGAGKGDGYAPSRYLLYYLQEKGLLRKYYRAFLAAQKTDPTGYATLKKVLGEKDMADFQRRWEAWVLTLRYP